MKTLPVTVLSGFVGAGKSAVLNHVLSSLDGLKVAVIVNEMGRTSPGAFQTSRAASRTSTGEKLIELSQGCICCTLRKDLLAEVSELAREGSFDYLLIESTGISEPLQIAETFAFVDENGDSLSESARLDTMVTLVDAQTFLDDFQCVDELGERGIGIDEDDDRDIARLLTDQIEFANVVLLNKTDLVSDEEAGQVLALLRKLNPNAQVLPIRNGQVAPEEILNTGRFGMDSADANASPFVPREGEGLECDEYGLRRFAYRARRPFHPQRFWDFWMDSEQAPHILRSEGYFWLATRHQMSGLWSQTGQVLSAEPGGPWWADTPREEWPSDEPELIAELESDWDDEWGDRRQELVIISHELDHDAVSEALTACLLTDEEMATGPSSWSRFKDPFGPWKAQDNETPHAQ